MLKVKGKKVNCRTDTIAISILLLDLLRLIISCYEFFSSASHHVLIKKVTL